LLNSEGTNRVNFYFPDGFPFYKPENYMTSVCNTIGIPLKNINFAVKPVDKEKLAFNIEGGIDNMTKLKKRLKTFLNAQ
jgi:hypothetical protein